MKRDLDLIRDLLAIIESADYDADYGLGAHNSLVNRLGLHPYDPRVQYHLRLLHEAGFVRGVGHTVDGAVSVRLTWQGHEFLEMARNLLVWERAKNYVVERTQGLSAAVLQNTLAIWSNQVVSDTEGWKVHQWRRIDLPHTASSNGASQNGAASTHAAKVRDLPLPPAAPQPTYYSTAAPRWTAYHAWDPPYQFDPHFQIHVWNGHAAETVPAHALY